MRAVAEGLVGGVPAAAERDDGAACKPVCVAGWVQDFEVAFDANGTVSEDGDFSFFHDFVLAGKGIISGQMGRDLIQAGA